LSIDATIEHAVQVLRGMAYEHRLHLLVVLQDGEQTPGALAAAVQLESTLVAHHLRYMREARLVRRQRRGRNVYYTLDGEATRRLVREVIHFAQQPG
jgi:DNA-binding transcriptional ArsR family regulator